QPPGVQRGDVANSDQPQRCELDMIGGRGTGDGRRATAVILSEAKDLLSGALGWASIALALSAISCSQPAGAKPVPPPTNQFIVGIDLSASRSVEALRDSRRLLDNLVESRLHNGDELVLLEMYGSTDTGDHQWIDSVPRARTPGVVTATDQRRLDDFKAVAHQ